MTDTDTDDLARLHRARDHIDELTRDWAAALADRDALIVALHADGHSMQRVADEAGVTRGRVSQIIAERSKRS